jgi:hypothetical protein
MTYTKQRQGIIISLLKGKRRTLPLLFDCQKCSQENYSMAHITPDEPAVGFRGDVEVDPDICQQCGREYTADEKLEAIETAAALYL